MKLHTILMIAAAVTAAVASGGIAGVPLIVAGIAGVASAGLGTAASLLSHGASTQATADAAIVAAAQKAADTLPQAHAALPVVKAILAATADDSNPAV